MTRNTNEHHFNRLGKVSQGIKQMVSETTEVQISLFYSPTQQDHRCSLHLCLWLLTRTVFMNVWTRVRLCVPLTSISRQ